MSISVSRVTAIAVFLGSSVLSTLPVHAQTGQWYLGAGAGISRLTPDTDGSDFTLDDDGSMAAGLYLGMDVGEWLGIEAAYTALGEAGLSGNETVGYTAISLGGIAYVLGEREARRRLDSWSGYVRFGLNKISNESDIQLDKEDNTALWLGAGVQWPVGPTWGFRGELTSFDGDAQAAMASVYWRPTARRTRSDDIARVPPAPSAPPIVKEKAPVDKPSTSPVDVSASATVEVPVSKPVDTPPPRPLSTTQAPAQLSGPSVSTCAVPAAGEPLDAQGCALFSGVLQGVEFEGDTTTLTPVGETLLSRMAGSLNRYPELVVEIRVHTQTYPDPERARNLSRERAVAVARFLVAQGVDVKRLKARAFGSTQPRAGNDTPGGRRLNNRVELRVL